MVCAALGCAPYFTAGPFGFAHTPQPELSVHLHQGLENLGVHDGSSLRIFFFPRMRATPITGPQNSLTGVQQGNRLGLRNAGDVRQGSKRLGQGQGDDRQPDSVGRAPVAA